MLGLSAVLAGVAGCETNGAPQERAEESISTTEEAFVSADTTLQSNYDTYKATYVKDVSHCGGVTPCKRVARLDEGNDTVSEGMGYGMLMSAYMNDRTTFDGLWNYYRTHVNEHGLMHWKWDANNNMTGANEATDAVEDAAIGLIVADKRGWGTPAGDSQTYNARAKDIIGRILQYMVSADNSPRPGDANWNVFDIIYNPSYFTAPYATIYATYTGVSRWNLVKDREYAMLAALDSKDAGSAATGLVPDWMCRDGTGGDGQGTCSLGTNIEWDRVNGGGAGSRTWWFSYDACRIPWRLAMDWSWHGDTRAAARLDKINTWASPKNGNIYNGYYQNGTEPATNLYPAGTKSVLGAFVGPLASASAKGTTTYQTTMWNKLVGLGQGSNYFSDTLRILNMMFLGGKMVNPLTITSGGSCTPNCAGKQCGSDGCSGACGTCASPSTCNASNQCVAPTCTPNCSGKQCGDDGCGGVCGTCATGQTCSANQCTTASSGSVSWEKWTNLTGTSINTSVLTTTVAPSSTGTFSTFEAPGNAGDNFQMRVRGYITPATTGSYTFWFASDDNGELWLSTNDQPSTKVKIASVTGWVDSARQWNKYASQKSAAINLTAGVKYYVEAIYKEGSGGDSMGVGWKLNNSTATDGENIIIPSSVLSPYTGGSTCTPNCSGKTCGDNGCGGSCGTCATGQTCSSSQTCVSTCTPNCSGKTCGSDGCSGSCGTCASGQTCNSSQTCSASCTPSTCSSLGKNCGSVSDGCGGTLNCGTCAAGNTCTANVCVASGSEPCTPNLTLDAAAGNSGNFNTSGAYCFRTPRDIVGWGCSNFDGRTLQINDVAKTPGSMPMPTKSNGYYYFEVSAGTYNYASCYWW